MMFKRPLRSLALGSLLLGPAVANADVVVLAPLIPARGVSADQAADLFALISSELEFMTGVDEVIEYNPAPTALTLACLDSTRCLGTLTKDKGGETFLSGAIDDDGADLLIDLVYYDARTNRVVRRKTHRVPANPAELVDRITPMLVEALTGVSEKDKEEDAMTGVDFASDDDDLAFEPEPAGRAIQATPPPEPPVVGRATARPVERTITPPPPPPPPPKEDEAFDPSEFDFGSSADDVSFGTGSADITFEEPAPRPAPRPAPEAERELFDEYDPGVVEMEQEFDEAPEPRERIGSPSTSSRTTSKGKGGKDDGWRRVYINVRGGYSNYGVFHFGTVGGELQVRAVGGLTFLVGVDGWFVNRELPPQLQTPQQTVVTQAIIPFHVGMIYRIKPGKFQPYVGVDGILSQYYTACVDPNTNQDANCPEDGSDPIQSGLVAQPRIAGGARLRLGFDYMVAKNFGFNVDVALGFLSGGDWPRVDPRLPALSFLPSVGAGITVAF